MNVVAMCTVSTGLTSIKFALDMGVKIQKVIGLDDILNRDEYAISGVVDISSFCKTNNLDFDYVSDYSLKTEPTKILGRNVDLIWVCGWQRLLPNSFINSAKLAVVGTHGSCDGITRGRGRSPQNWALLIGAEKFEMSMFKIALGVDDGDVVATGEFELNKFDNITSSYVKASFLVAKMFSDVYHNPAFLADAKKQIGEVSYFPKRTPIDGAIDWEMSTTNVHNQIRALAPPYPNSFSTVENLKVYFKQSLPIIMKTSYQAGEIVHVMQDKSILVACGDGLLHVLDYHIEGKSIDLVPQLKFNSVSISQSANIISKRFYAEFPNKKINQTLLNFWSSNGIRLV